MESFLWDGVALYNYLFIYQTQMHMNTHQIRVHLAHIGHGVIGDPLYGRPPRAAQMPDNLARDGLSQMRKFDRQALHAAYLGFSHPVTGEALSFETPLPTDMASLLALIEDTVSARARSGTT